jgi:F-type H+-transporting ATPase subunit alpha
MPVAHQIAILYCGTHGLLKDISIHQVDEFETQFLTAFTPTEEYKKLEKGVLDEEVCKKIEQIAATLTGALKTIES